MTAGAHEKERMVDLWLPRPTAGAVLLTAIGQEYGVASEALLEGTGLDRADLHDPAMEIAATQELQIVRNLVNAVPVPGLGFVVGRRYHRGICREWTYAILTSRTLREAFEVGVCYAELFCTFSMVHIVDQGSLMKIVVDDSAVPSEFRRFLLERDLAAVFAAAAAAATVVGRPRLESVNLALPAPGQAEHRRKYLAALGVQPLWNADENSFSFDAEALTRPLHRTVAPEITQEARRACEQRLARVRRRRGFIGTVREAIAMAPPAASQAEIAARLHMSLRTLRRRLSDEGTTFRDLTKETWGEVAEELLARGLTVEQVADRVGYAGPSSFTRAFKDWRGMSPGTFGRCKRGKTTVEPAR